MAKLAPLYTGGPLKPELRCTLLIVFRVWRSMSVLSEHNERVPHGAMSRQRFRASGTVIGFGLGGDCRCALAIYQDPEAARRCGWVHPMALKQIRYFFYFSILMKVQKRLVLRALF